MAQTPRPYQEDTLAETAFLLAKGNWSVLVPLATGGGKTTIMAEWLRRTYNPKTQRVLILAHTQEIIYQIETRIRGQFDKTLDYWYVVDKKMVPGIGIVMGSAHDNPHARIVVATWQSLQTGRVNDILSYGKIDLIIYDECHHIAPGNEAYTLINQVKHDNPAVKMIGFTATPERTDNKALSAVFQVHTKPWTIVDGIAQKYLVPPTVLGIKTKLVREYDDDDHTALGSNDAVLDADNWIELVIDKWFEKTAGKRPTLAFFATVPMSKLFVQTLKSKGFKAEHIDGTTHKDDRKQWLAAFHAGEISVLSNYNVLTEGVDTVTCSCIIDARPTSSQLVKRQMYGRGLRTHIGKKDCLVLKFTTDSTGIMDDDFDLAGRMVTCEECKAENFFGFKTCQVCGASLVKAKEDKDKLPEIGELIPDIEAPGTEGRGTVESVVSLFGTAFARWYEESGWYSAGLAFDDGALIIAPPNGQVDQLDGLRYQMRAAIDYLGTLAEDHPERGSLLIDIESYQRQIARVEEYTLYHVAKSGAVRVIDSNADLTSLFVRGDAVAASKAKGHKEYKKQIARTSRWVNDPATDAQLGWMRWKKILIKPHLTKGEASAIRTQYETVPFVKDFIDEDYVPEQETT
jgi:superfamily II DNA or RNA helicase